MKKIVSTLLCISLIIFMSIGASVTASASTEETLVLDKETEIVITNYNSAILYFTPEVDGYYTLQSFSDGIDPYGELYNSDDYWLNGSDNDNGLDFKLTEYLYAGESYSYRVNYYQSKNDITFKVMLTLEADDETVLGDVDGDGVITVMDTTNIQLHLAQVKLLEGDSLELADTNKDGNISIIDATRIQLFIAQLIPQI